MSLDEGDAAPDSSGRAVVALALAPDGVSLAATLEGCALNHIFVQHHVPFTCVCTPALSRLFASRCPPL